MTTNNVVEQILGITGTPRQQEYSNHYWSLVNKATRRELPKDTYVERHHVYPQSATKQYQNDYVVSLLPEEHYVAHQLLAKLFPEDSRFTFAAHRMANGKNRNNRLYGWIRRKANEMKKGQVPWNKGAPRSEEVKAKVSATLKKRYADGDIAPANKGIRQPYKPRPGRTNKGKTLSPASEERKKKISDALTGRTLSEEHKAKLRGRPPHNKGGTRITVNGADTTTVEAAQKYNVSLPTVHNRCRNPKFEGWEYK